MTVRPEVAGDRSPDDVRWIASGNDVLHAVPLILNRDRTVCGILLRSVNWRSFAGPSRPRAELERHDWAICQHCDYIVDWVPPRADAVASSESEPEPDQPGTAEGGST